MPINLCGIFPIILCVFDFDVSAYVSGGTWIRAFVHNKNNNNNVCWAGSGWLSRKMSII